MKLKNTIWIGCCLLVLLINSDALNAMTTSTTTGSTTGNSDYNYFPATGPTTGSYNYWPTTGSTTGNPDYNYFPATGPTTGSYNYWPTTGSTTGSYNYWPVTGATTGDYYYGTTTGSSTGNYGVIEETFYLGCDDVFTDFGGSNVYYNNENTTWIICPDDAATEYVSVIFTYFDLESWGSGGCYDELFIYNGDNPAAPYIGSYCYSYGYGTGYPGGVLGTPINSTDASGCLYFNFLSDGSVRHDGWEAVIQCVPLGEEPDTTGIVTYPYTGATTGYYGWTTTGSTTGSGGWNPWVTSTTGTYSSPNTWNATTGSTTGSGGWNPWVTSTTGTYSSPNTWNATTGYTDGTTTGAWAATGASTGGATSEPVTGTTSGSNTVDGPTSTGATTSVSTSASASYNNTADDAELEVGACLLLGTTTEITQGNNGGVSTYAYNSLSVAIETGVAPYTFDWDAMGYVRHTVVYPTNGEATTLNVIYSDSAVWSVTITDASGCEMTVNLFDNNLPLHISGYDTQADFGSGTGEIDIFVQGGSGNYSYTWGGPYGYASTNQNISGLSMGWYAVTVSDTDTNELTMGWYWIEGRRRGRGKIGASTPAEVQMQAMPNPFVNTTNIEFSLAESDHVLVEVYSTNGAKVATLFNEQAQSNKAYKLAFDANNLPSGMYLCKLSTNKGVQQHTKLMLLK